MVPEFAAAAFALKPGQLDPDPGQDPVRLARDQGGRGPHRPRAASFDQVRDEIRQQIIQAGVRAALDKARVGLVVQKFNMDGSAR